MKTALAWAKGAKDISDLADACDEVIKRLSEKFARVRTVASVDPNEKVGPTGFGPEGFIPTGEVLMYVIYFENLAQATAEAEEIVITDTLDLDLDWTWFEFGDSSHPAFLTTSFDANTGTATWRFSGINLPPNVNPPEGEGWVSFTIRQRPDLPTGTQIRNKAAIVFDFNPPIETPEVLNTIDVGGPSSAVLPLNETQSDAEFLVSWEGQDDEGGSGIRDYTIYMAMDDEPYAVWLANTAETSATFTGEHGHSYKFYSVATDNVGHVEPAPEEPDAVTAVAVLYSLTVSVTAGEGVVSPSEGMFVEGTPVTLTSAPGEDYRFQAWTGVDTADGNTATVVMNADRTVGVEFAVVVRYELTLTVVTAPGQGTVSLSEGVFDEGTTVTLTATPSEGSQVRAWTGVDTADGNTAMVIMNTDRMVTVEFEEIPVTGPPVGQPVPAPCGVCGAGAPAMLVISLCALGFARVRRRYRR